MVGFFGEAEAYRGKRSENNAQTTRRIVDGLLKLLNDSSMQRDKTHCFEFTHTFLPVLDATRCCLCMIERRVEARNLGFETCLDGR